MKKLQNNFTTPEQSKRLLELGVPADNADGFYSRESYRGGKWERPKLFESEEDKVNFKSVYEGGVLMYFPLFTVGRLIEIYGICTGIAFFELPIDYNNQIDDMIGLIKDAIDAKWLDFSKLEE